MTALIRVRAGAPSWLLALLALGLFVRAVTILALPPHTWFEGGDGPYYARQAWFIAHGRAVDPMHTIGPLYPLMLATAWRPFAHDAEPPPPSAVPAAFLTTVRLAQALIGVLTAGLVYLLARRLGQSRGSAAVGVVGVSLGPAFVIEPFLIRTETLSILLLTGAVLLYVRRPSTWPGIIATGVTCGLAALARPVLLLFPVAFALAHLAGAEQARRGREAAALLAAALLTVAPWHAWLHTTHGRWLPAGFSANLLHGAYDDGGPPNPATVHIRLRRSRPPG
jgi:4-amino-4-deoxy-L-arabinose transferase-like glycosyltransferase